MAAPGAPLKKRRTSSEDANKSRNLVGELADHGGSLILEKAAPTEMVLWSSIITILKDLVECNDALPSADQDPAGLKRGMSHAQVTGWIRNGLLPEDGKTSGVQYYVCPQPDQCALHTLLVEQTGGKTLKQRADTSGLKGVRLRANMATLKNDMPQGWSPTPRQNTRGQAGSLGNYTPKQKAIQRSIVRLQEMTGNQLCLAALEDPDHDYELCTKAHLMSGQNQFFKSLQAQSNVVLPKRGQALLNLVRFITEKLLISTRNMAHKLTLSDIASRVFDVASAIDPMTRKASCTSVTKWLLRSLVQSDNVVVGVKWAFLRPIQEPTAIKSQWETKEQGAAVAAAGGGGAGVASSSNNEEVLPGTAMTREQYVAAMERVLGRQKSLLAQAADEEDQIRAQLGEAEEKRRQLQEELSALNYAHNKALEELASGDED